MTESSRPPIEVPAVLSLVPGPVRDIGARAIHAVRDSLSSKYHLDRLLEEETSTQIERAEALKTVEEFAGNSHAVVFQNKTIVRILAVNLARKLEAGGEPLEDRILQLKHVMGELPEETDVEMLGLPAPVMDIIRPYI